MGRLVFLALMMIPWAARAQTDDQNKQFFEQIFPLAQESYEVGVGIGCGAVNQKFVMLASL
jgi:hypothetical protein